MVVSRTQTERFRDLVSARLGLHFDDAKLDNLATVLVARANALRLPSVESYFASVDADETAVLAERLTVGETYFFRNASSSMRSREIVLPASLARGAADHPLGRLRVGRGAVHARHLRARERAAAGRRAIRAIDVNPAAIARAVRARYSSWSLRETLPADLAPGTSARDGSRSCSIAEVRAMVALRGARTCSTRTLAFWAPDAFDVVFCRNVIMYFTPEDDARGRRAHRALARARAASSSSATPRRCAGISTTSTCATRTTPSTTSARAPTERSARTPAGHGVGASARRRRWRARWGSTTRRGSTSSGAPRSA